MSATTPDSAAAPDLSLIESQIERYRDEAEQLLEELVSVRSVNPRQPGVDGEEYAGEETRANRLLGERLADVGMDLHSVEADPGRENLVGVLHGSGAGRSLALNGHIDTVGPQQGRFPDPWRPERVDGLMYGLGTTDMKAGHAAMWLAVKALREANVSLRGDLHVHSVVGEETMDHRAGTTAVLEAGFRTDAALIMEPTSTGDGFMNVSNTAPGNALFSVSVEGRSTHWASRNLAIRPGGMGAEVGVNAIDKIVQVYEALRRLEDEWGLSMSHPQFPPGAFIIHPGVLRADVGFEAAPYFPDRGRLDYLLSFPPGVIFEEVRMEVEAQLRHACALDPWLREHPAVVEWHDTWPPAYTSPDGDFARAALSARNGAVGAADAPGCVPAGAQSDASFYEAQGVATLVSGPGNLLRAHAPDEAVDLDMIPVTAKMIARLAVDWCG